MMCVEVAYFFLCVNGRPSYMSHQLTSVLFSVDEKWETSKSVYPASNFLNHFVQTFWVWIHFHFSGVNGLILFYPVLELSGRYDTLCPTDTGELQYSAPLQVKRTNHCGMLYHLLCCSVEWVN